MKLLEHSVALLVAHRQFNDEEYQNIRSVLEREGCRIRIVGTSMQAAVGMRGTKVQPQQLLSDTKPEQSDAIVLVGGVGARDHWAHPRVHNVVRAFDAAGKTIAAICVAPVTLGRAGLLKGKSATCHVSAKRELEETGALYSAEQVTRSGRFLTGNGPESSRIFAETLVDILEAAF